MSAPEEVERGERGWRGEQTAGSYLAAREAIIPMLDVMEDLVRRLLSRAPRPPARFLDLGCGGGAMSELVASIAPENAEGVLVDFSEPMLAAARQRAGSHPGWRVVRGDLAEAGWRQAIPDGPYDAVVSGLAIHHLTTARKPELFAEIRDLLAPGGVFLNLDYVAVGGLAEGLWDEEMLAAAVRDDHRHGGTRSEHEVDADIFDDSGEDRPDSAAEQLRWLRAAGFEQVDVHFKWAEAAVFGGLRPTTT